MNKILLVDEDRILAQMYRLKFEHSGFEVHTAADGTEGLMKIRQLRPDLVILDLVLPKLGGKALFEKIRFDPELKDIPVVVLSNLDNPDGKSRMLEMGARAYFVKSEFTPSQVVDRIRELMDNP